MIDISNDAGAHDRHLRFAFLSTLLRRPVRANASEWVWLGPMTAIVAITCIVAVISSWGFVTIDIVTGYAWWARWFLPILAWVALAESASRWITEGGVGGRGVLDRLKSRLNSPTEVFATLGPIVFLVMLSTSMGVMKMLLPVYQTFSWDTAFARADEVLFVGYPPWKITHAVFGAMWPTIVIDRLYTFWVYLLPIPISVVALFAPRFERARFFLSYAFVATIVGIAGAYAFASAGPCYAQLVSPELAHEFEPLISRLNAISNDRLLWAVEWQSILLWGYQTRTFDVGLGISAMPSVHVAVAVLYALTLSVAGRLWGLFGWLFAAAIYIGSIHLAWHYALDGLVSAIATVLIWKAVYLYLRFRGYGEPSTGPAPWLAKK